MVCPHCRAANPDDTASCVRCSMPIDFGDTSLPPSAGTGFLRAEDAPTVGIFTDDTATVALPPVSEFTGPGFSQPPPLSITGWTSAERGEPTSRSVEIGSVLGGRYEIIKLLGEGGMGSVYRARDRELDRMVALKVIRPELARNEQILQRFKQELILARQVTHRNIIRIFDLGQADGVKFITMEYIEGEDLSDVLERRKKLPVDEALAIMLQVCQGLQAAHSEGVVHRDLKPQNIMLDPQGKASVMDFGIARSMHSTNMTRTGALMGTPAYMSPEQAQGSKVDARSDLYTLGIIFYELVTGKVPFDAEHPMAMLVRRLQEKPQPPIELEPDLPKRINEIILKMLATKPEDRFQTAAEVAAALDDWDAERSGRKKPVVQPVGKPLQIAAAVMAVLLAVVGWLYWKQRSALPVGPMKAVTLLVSDFRNATNDPVFDGTIENTLSLAMEGAAFVSAYPRAEAHRVGAQLQSGAIRLDESLARLVAIKQGVSVVLSGSIEPKGAGYSVLVRAIDAVTGKPITERSSTASSKQDVLAAVGKLAPPIRKALGDATPESAQLAAAETYSSGSLEAAQAYAQAQELQWSGKWDEAIQAYQRAVQLDPNLGRAYTGLAVASANLGQRQEAERYFQQAMARIDRMSDRERYRTRGAYYLAMRNDQKAIDEYSALVKQFPGDDAGRTNLALAYFYARNNARAVEEGRRAIEIYPRNQLYRNNVALFAMYAGDFDTAIREAAEVLKLNPAYAKAYLATALSQLAQGKTAEAVQNYRKMEGVSARGASLAAIGLADAAIYEGRESEGAALLEKGIAADLAANAKGSAAVKLAALATVTRDRAKAIATVGRALDGTRGEAVLFSAGRVLIANGQEARALTLAKTLAERLEPEPQAYAKLLEAEAALAHGKPRDALRLIQEAQKLADTWIGRLDLGRAYLDAGAFTEASSEFDACLKRRGEATAVFLDDVPSYRYFPSVYYYLARAQEGMHSPGAAESYRTFLTIKAQNDGTDPLVSDARKRSAALSNR